MAVERLRERLRRATSALNRAHIDYAVCGGNAVAEWVGRVDQGAVRFTKDIDILIRRRDLPAIVTALQDVGFIHRTVHGEPMFLDGGDAGPRDAVHVVFADEKVQEHYCAAAPQVTDAEKTPHYSVLSLESLVTMKLTSFRDRDKTHLRDMLEVGLIDKSWVDRFPIELAKRLKQLIDTPEE